MKFNILGFSQKGLVSLGLDTIDAMLLRYFIDFKATSKMLTEKVDGNTYFWVRYDAVLAELPILNIKKCTVQARFFKLRNAGVLTHYVKKSGGTYSFFGLGDKYKLLIENEETSPETKELASVNSIPVDASEEKEESLTTVDSSLEVMDSNQPPSSSIVDAVYLNVYRSTLNVQGYQFKLLTNNPSTKDPSIKNNITSSSKKTAYKYGLKKASQSPLHEKHKTDTLNKYLPFHMQLFHLWDSS